MPRLACGSRFRILPVLLLALVASLPVASAATLPAPVTVEAVEVMGDVTSPADTPTPGAETPPTMRAEFNGLETFGRFLADVERRTSDTRPLMRRIAEYGRSSTVKRVKAGVDVEGRRLAPNAESTIARKGSSKPLVDNADFLGSQTVDSGPEHAAWGSNLPQAAAITAGTDKAGRNRDTVLPERQVYGLNDADEREVDRLAVDWLSSGRSTSPSR